MDERNGSKTGEAHICSKHLQQTARYILRAIFLLHSFNASRHEKFLTHRDRK
jgi:hypothetical protein